MSFAPLDPAVAAYLDSLVPPRAPALAALETEAARTGFPIIGPTAGWFCYLVTRLVRARTVFELGSGFGYSTAWLARGVWENGGGVVHHTERDAALSARARALFGTLGLGDVVQCHVGEAVETLRGMPGSFDLVLIDIDKAAYPAALALIRERLRAGGVLIADNALWHGRVLDPGDRSPDTEGVREFTRRLTTDTDWLAGLVPIRDGLLLATRR